MHKVKVKFKEEPYFLNLIHACFQISSWRHGKLYETLQTIRVQTGILFKIWFCDR